MEGDIVNSVLELYKDSKWRDIVDRYHDHPERNKLLWVYPSGENFQFLKQCLEDLLCTNIVSIGCGSGLLEWIMSQATGIPVSGVEVDGAWWHCKYAPPTFIPLLFTPMEIDKEIITLLSKPHTALMFCYFNARAAFENYLNKFSGNVLIIIGPGEGKGVHTEPRPFEEVDNWKLYKWQEVRQSRDFIAVYVRECLRNGVMKHI
ncbi:hypothetical protein O3G_MSEX002012 [Manduca sexta]|uniref:Uncharacterized protein n=1 Tax=Manduca sexta TaxID=7130 RepID=A0A921YM14_MANSE|nr:hypothetical protein O3G_MSEX002012 [Manduca sexta]